MTSPSPSDLVVTPELEQRLAQGLRLYIETYGDDDDQMYPSFLGMDLSTEVLEHMLKRTRTCISEGLSMVEEANQWPHDVEDDEGVTAAVRFWAVRYNAGTFWWRGLPQDGGSCETRAVHVRDLLLALQTDASYPAEQVPLGYQWYGGALLYSPRPELKLATYIGACRPELEANQRALEMSAAIAGQRDGDPSDQLPTARRRPAL